eukprot:1564989-Pyramimonas_sp.AAC.1
MFHWLREELLLECDRVDEFPPPIRGAGWHKYHIFRRAFLVPRVVLSGRRGLRGRSRSDHLSDWRCLPRPDRFEPKRLRQVTIEPPSPWPHEAQGHASSMAL